MAKMNSVNIAKLYYLDYIMEQPVSINGNL